MMVEFDRVEMGAAGFQYRDCAPLHRFVLLQLDELEGPGADRLGAHLATGTWQG